MMAKFKNVAFVFPGGGSHFLGMGRSLEERSAIAREIFQEASEVLGYDFRSTIDSYTLEKLSDTRQLLESVFVNSVAACKTFMAETGIMPSVAAGHSLGEYSALVCTGWLSFADGLRLLSYRGELLGKAGEVVDGAMMSVSKITAIALEDHCRALRREGVNVYLSIKNTPLQHVVSGSKKDLQILGGQLDGEGAMVRFLNIATASHCPLMTSAKAPFAEMLAQVQFSEGFCPVISNITARPFQGPDDCRYLLAEQLVGCVKWNQSVKNILNSGVNLIIDVGPQSVIKRICNNIDTRIEAFAADVSDDMLRLQNLVGNRENPGYYLHYCLAQAASARNYNGNNPEVVLHVQALFEQLRTLQQDVNANPLSVCQNAYDLTYAILIAKGIPEEELKVFMDESSSHFSKKNQHMAI